MPAPSTTDEFLALVAKSDLFPSDRLEEFLARRRGDDSLPHDNLRLAQLLVHDGLLTKYQAEQLLSGRWRNFVIGGKYKLLERLGKGGMALVFLCEHQVMKRLVALKILPTAHASDKELLGRFHREARALSQLRHPNIVGAYDADQANKVHFLVMEYVDGGDLDQIVSKAGPLSWERAANYIMQAALGLQHAHECGLVHRDIKPGNLLVDRTGRVKLLDLGLARIFHETTDDLTTGRDAKTLLGTIDYLAPEQALNSHEVDIRADIYSLGATFYFCLTGQGLFEDGSVAQKLSWHLHRPPSPISNFRNDVPTGLIKVIEKMLAKDPEERYQTPDDVVEALEPWTRVPIDPPSPDELPQISKAARSVGNPSSVRMTVPVSKSLVANPHRLSGSTSKSRISTAESSTIRNRPSSNPSIADYDDEMTPVIRRGSATRFQPDEIPWFRQPRNIGLIAAGILGILGLSAWALSGSKPAANDNVALKPTTNESAAPIDSTGPKTVPNDQPSKPSSLVASDTPADVSITLASSSATPRPFPTLREAIRAAKAGDKVVVRGTLMTEALELSDVDGAPRDLTIEGINPQGKEKPVRWRAPSDISLGRALLDVVGLDGFKLKGFLFDGQGKIADLVRLSGRGSGSSLEMVQFEKSTRASLVFRGYAGETSRPARIEKVRFTTLGESEAGILFETDPDRTSVPSESIRIINCRFVGPFQAAVELAGPVVGLEVEQNRFYGATDAFRYRRGETRNPLKIRISNNTFVDLQRGLHFETTPPASTSDLVISNNVFTGTPRLATLDKVSVQPHQVLGKWLWTNEERKSASIPPGNRLFRKSFDLAAVPEKATLDIGCDETFTVFVNGYQVFKNPSPHFTQRVYAFNVADKLKKGKNCVAVLASNALDRLDSKFGTTAGLIAQLTIIQAGKEAVAMKSDNSWKWSDQAPETWNRIDFNDESWAFAKPWPDDGSMMPWKFAVWDSAVLSQLKSPLEPINVTVTGNIRDYKSWDGYPTLDSERGAIAEKTFPRDPTDDNTFLRYTTSSPLMSAGPGDSPVGAFVTEEK